MSEEPKGRILELFRGQRLTPHAARFFLHGVGLVLQQRAQGLDDEEAIRLATELRQLLHPEPGPSAS